MKEFVVENIKIKVGSNAAENWKILDESSENNIFLHLKSFPSCYVIIDCEEYPSIEIINEAAKICKNNTRYKNMKNIKVDYTSCKNVIKGELVGEIFYKSNKKVNNLCI
jgi:predicted ribosome quality control (RQC) complex YloA/Tae2 family protein